MTIIRLLTSFVPADVWNQFKIKRDAIVANDRLIKHCATDHCACKTVAMLL